MTVITKQRDSIQMPEISGEVAFYKYNLLLSLQLLVEEGLCFC